MTWFHSLSYRRAPRPWAHGKAAARRWARCLLLFLLPVLCLPAGCDMGGTKSTEFIRFDGDYLVLDNGRIRLLVRRDNGYIATVRNETTGTIHKSPDEGAWPFMIQAGENRNPVSITRNCESRVGRIEVTAGQENGRTFNRAVVRYEDLVYDHSGQSCGILADVTYTLFEGEDSIRFSASFDISTESGGLYGVWLCSGGHLRANADQAGEILTVPMWGSGQSFDDPARNASFLEGQTVGYPGMDMRTLEAGWMDLHDGSAGIGIAYVNRQQMAMEFRIGAQDGGMEIVPILLQPRKIIGKAVPVPEGRFSTDEVIVAAHQGDWHRMADIYRSAYLEAFVLEDGSPDHLTWETTSRTARESDYIIRFFAGLDGALVTTFAQMGDIVESHLRNIQKTEEPDGSQCMVWIAGQNEKGYAFDVPVMVPAFGPAGGTEGLVDLMERLHGLGCTAYHYEHPFAVDPDGAGYIPEADPLQHTEHWNLVTHHAVCLDNAPMMTLWKDTLIPQLRSVGADGIQFDQASLQQTVCDLPDHRHGLDAVSRLSSHIRAINELARMVRSELGQEAYIVSEGYNDLTCRYIDCAQTGWHNPALWGGRKEPMVRSFTFPWVVNHYNGRSVADDGTGFFTTTSFLVAILGGQVCLNEGESGAAGPSLHAFRNTIRAAEAPGFPYGFRDTIGVTASDDKVTVKAFRDETGITCTWLGYGTETDCTITVDGSALGFPEIGIRTLPIHADPFQMGFEVIRP